MSQINTKQSIVTYFYVYCVFWYVFVVVFWFVYLMWLITSCHGTWRTLHIGDLHQGHFDATHLSIMLITVLPWAVWLIICLQCVVALNCEPVLKQSPIYLLTRLKTDCKYKLKSDKSLSLHKIIIIAKYQHNVSVCGTFFAIV